MYLFCLLVVAGAVAAIDPDYSSGYGRTTIEGLAILTEELEYKTQGVSANISDVQTLCAVIDDEINEIYDFFVASVTNINKQQYELIASYQAQEKTIQHKIDEAKSLEKQAISLAEATQASVTDQINKYLNGSEIGEVNVQQEKQIDDLKYDIVNSKHDFLSNLTDTIYHLEKKEYEVDRKLALLDDFVGKRKCEYGSGFLDEGLTKIFFKTKFLRPPNVTLSLTGFVAHLDHHDYKEDVLSLAKIVTAESTEFFTVAAYDSSEGQVDVKYVSCSWMACQYLEGLDVNLSHH